MTKRKSAAIFKLGTAAFRLIVPTGTFLVCVMQHIIMSVVLMAEGLPKESIFFQARAGLKEFTVRFRFQCQLAKLADNM